MKPDVENNEWKAEAPYLASLQKGNPFLVPEKYFDTLPESIHHSVYLHHLKGSIATTGFSVPDGYFDSLKDQILLETGGSILAQLPAADGYTTPDLYFEQLQAKIFAKTITPESAPTSQEQILSSKTESKIIRLWRSGLLKYASAACFVLASAFGFYLNQHNFSPEPTATEIANEQMLYDISEQDVIDHVEGNTPDVPNTSPADTDLETYILNNYSQSDLSSAL